MVDKEGKKTGGRVKGVRNKKTQALVELIAEHYEGFDPVLEMIDIFKNEKTPVDLKVSILKDITPYIYPRRKSIEADVYTNVQGSGIDLSLSIEDLIEKANRQKLQNSPTATAF